MNPANATDRFKCVNFYKMDQSCLNFDQENSNAWCYYPIVKVNNSLYWMQPCPVSLAVFTY